MSAPLTGIHAAAHHMQLPPVESGRVEFVCADLLEWQALAGQFDLIVTNFFLDCFPPDELAAVVRKLGQLAAPDADWLLADFEIAPAGPARWRGQLIVAILYRFFRIVTGLKANALIPPDDDLATADFSRHRRLTCEWGLLKSERWRRSPVAEFISPAQAIRGDR